MVLQISGSLSSFEELYKRIMKPLRMFAKLLLIGTYLLTVKNLTGAESALNPQADQWRSEHRLIDLHQHINGTTQHITRAVKVMDAVGLGIGVNLTAGTVTPGKNGGPSEFERTRRMADSLFPGRFIHYMNLDYTGWDKADFAERAAKQIDEGYRLGAAGFKQEKTLGLYLRDGAGKLIRIDDPKLDGVWERCGELGMPVSIHVADPRAFWLPYDEKNERWKELKDHKNWWFGDTNKYPPRMDLLNALNRVIERHPKTTFVCVHFANNSEEIDWVDQMLDRYPNMNADLAARIPEIGRHDPKKVHDLFVKHQDRIFFATDFQVYNRLILGSSGNEPPPTDADAEMFYHKEYRWLETWDKDWPHMTPIQGDWTISAIGLPAPVLRKIYFDNARKLLGHSLPAPVLKASRIENDFQPKEGLGGGRWSTASPVRMEYQSANGAAKPEVSTEVRALWSSQFLYLRYDSPYTKLTVFEDTPAKERLGLWDRDVVEAFIGTDLRHPNRYTEFEIAPTNEKLDLKLDLPQRDFEWSSGFESAVHIDHQGHRWVTVMRIPLSQLSAAAPLSGERWRINLYRCDRANGAFLAWNPTLQGSFHAPERFGELVFEN
jgi:predicted TIM-barrel fold metal-dependent hydrolase